MKRGHHCTEKEEFDKAIAHGHVVSERVRARAWAPQATVPCA